MILLSVAHSAKDRGAHNGDQLLNEHDISFRATHACYRRLFGAQIQAHEFQCGWVDDFDYAPMKIKTVNALLPDLAVEMHCNWSPNPAHNYSEVIHHPGSPRGKSAATFIASALEAGMGAPHHKWPSRGARPNTIDEDKHHDFFLWKTDSAAVIVEGLFISNAEQCAWLAKTGAEAYGLLVADGILEWIKSEDTNGLAKAQS